MEYTFINFNHLVFINSNTGNSEFSFEFIEEKESTIIKPSSYVPSYTAGLTFFLAVAATNLFHQGNWQRVYAAKNYQTLKQSLINCLFL